MQVIDESGEMAKQYDFKSVEQPLYKYVCPRVMSTQLYGGEGHQELSRAAVHDELTRYIPVHVCCRWWESSGFFKPIDEVSVHDGSIYLQGHNILILSCLTNLRTCCCCSRRTPRAASRT